MSTPARDQPRIADEDAHNERLSLDQQIRTLTDKLRAMTSASDRLNHHQGLRELREMQDRRKDAFRREVGWTG